MAIDYSSYRFLKVEKAENGVATVTMDDAEKLNSVGPENHKELEYIWIDLARDEEIRAIVLTGAGRAFSAGGDVKKMAARAGTDFGLQYALRVPQNTLRLFEHMLLVPQPIIAAVNGDAIGLGAILATLADAAFIAPGAQLGDRHVAGGVTAGNGSAALWPLLVGINRTKQLLFGAELLDAATAVEVGLITAVADDPLAAAREQAVAWAAMPAYALQTTKRALNQHLRAAVANVMPLALALEEQSLARLDPRFRPWEADAKA
jgi:enoyl-CoA hydratase/carnithine racemase